MRSISDRLGLLLLDHVPHQGRGVDARELQHLLGAGGRGDVDLGQVVADHVDADEDQAAFLQIGADGGADFQVARGQFDRRRRAADAQVGTDLILGRDAKL